MALNFALDFPQKVKTLVLIGTPYKVPKVAFSAHAEDIAVGRGVADFSCPVVARGGHQQTAPAVGVVHRIAQRCAVRREGEAQVMELIRSSTNRPGGGWDAQTGYGTIDMGRTLEAARALGGGAPEA